MTYRINHLTVENGLDRVFSDEVSASARIPWHSQPRSTDQNPVRRDSDWFLQGKGESSPARSPQLFGSHRNAWEPETTGTAPLSLKRIGGDASTV